MSRTLLFASFRFNQNQTFESNNVFLIGRRPQMFDLFFFGRIMVDFSLSICLCFCFFLTIYICYFCHFSDIFAVYINFVVP